MPCFPFEISCNFPQRSLTLTSLSSAMNPSLDAEVLAYACIRIATSYFVTDVRVPGVSPVGIASRAASPAL